MPTRSFSDSGSQSKHLTPVTRARAVRQTVAAAEAMHRESAVKNDSAVLVEQQMKTGRTGNPNAAGNWVYDSDRGKYLNTVTGEIADEPDTDIPAAGTLSVSGEEEEGFTLSGTQHGMGIRLAISAKSGLIRRCPNCNRRRLLLVPKEGATFLVCADAMDDTGACDFYRKV